MTRIVSNNTIAVILLLSIVVSLAGTMTAVSEMSSLYSILDQVNIVDTTIAPVHGSVATTALVTLEVVERDDTIGGDE